MRVLKIAWIATVLSALTSVSVLADDNVYPNITVSNVVFDPPLGSVLKAHEPVVVTFDYSYSRPNEELHVWVKVADDTFGSTYEGSMESITPGKGRVSRYYYLTEPGVVYAIDILMKDGRYEERFRETREVDFIFTENEDVEASSEDGLGSRIKAVSFDVAHPARLKPGTPIAVSVEYEIDSQFGLDIWVVPDTDCNMSYAGSTETQTGTGVVVKGFVVSEQCEVSRLKLVMANSANKTVYAEYVDVDIRYE